MNYFTCTIRQNYRQAKQVMVHNSGKTTHMAQSDRSYGVWWGIPKANQTFDKPDQNFFKKNLTYIVAIPTVVLATNYRRIV